MSNSMQVTASDLGALTKQYQAITHNLANANTVGYKRHVSRFHRIMNDKAAEGGVTPGEDQIGHNVRNVVSIDFEQGMFHVTNRPLDLAIDGKGTFFVIETDKGPLYTRNGSLHVGPNGRLVDLGGRPVAGEGGPITLPKNVPLSQVVVGRDGTITAGDNTIGKIRLAHFKDTTVLRPAGNGCFRASSQIRPEVPKDVKILQHRIEHSNVSAVEELVKLIQVTRLYEAGIKSITSQDERLKNLMRVAQG
jgi:flagellar basal body rod protein FlgG